MGSHASVSSLAVMGRCISGGACAVWPLHECHCACDLCLLQSDWVTLIGLAICSCCCMRWTGRSQEANWVDFAPASSGANGTATDKCIYRLGELRACNT